MRTSPILAASLVTFASILVPLAAAASLHFECHGTARPGISTTFCGSGFQQISSGVWSVQVRASAPSALGHIQGALADATFDCFPTPLTVPCDFNAELHNSGQYHLVAQFDAIQCSAPCPWWVKVDIARP